MGRHSLYDIAEYQAAIQRSRARSERSVLAAANASDAARRIIDMNGYVTP
jgi:hypothetical protein